MALNPRLQDWRDRTVWVLGASTGIGRATASLLHAQGAQVVVSARSEQALADFVAAHPGSVAVPLDVTDRAAVERAHAQVMRQARAGRLDLLMYCAGHYQPMRADTFDLDEALRHERINLDGVWHVLAAALPTLRQQGGGHLSLVASVAGFRGLPKALAYGPTKAAINNLAETL
jgi:NAD(P)-dependent dehydrogenase (short-subunit alcohol dehydrogenase family)